MNVNVKYSFHLKKTLSRISLLLFVITLPKLRLVVQLSYTSGEFHLWVMSKIDVRKALGERMPRYNAIFQQNSRVGLHICLLARLFAKIKFYCRVRFKIQTWAYLKIKKLSYGQRTVEVFVPYSALTLFLSRCLSGPTNNALRRS